MSTKKRSRKRSRKISRKRSRKSKRYMKGAAEGEGEEGEGEEGEGEGGEGEGDPPTGTGIKMLPEQLINEICSHLDPKSCMMLRDVNRYMRDAVIMDKIVIEVVNSLRRILKGSEEVDDITGYISTIELSDLKKLNELVKEIQDDIEDIGNTANTTTKRKQMSPILGPIAELKDIIERKIIERKIIEREKKTPTE